MSGASALGGMSMRMEGQQAEQLFQAHSNMMDIAQKTGGRAFYNRNDIDNALQTGVDDGSTYYAVGYYPENKDWNGKFRKIEVTSSRPDIKLRYRTGYFAVDKIAYAKGHAQQGDAEFSQALELDSPVATEMQFEATVLPPSPETENKISIQYRIDPRSIEFDLRDDGLEHAQIDCAVRAFPVKKLDKSLKTDGTRINAGLKPDVYARIVTTYFPCRLNVDLPAGDYILRLAVRDSGTGLVGTANARLTVPAATAESKPPKSSH